MLKLIMKLLDAASERLEAWAGTTSHTLQIKPPNATYRAYTTEFDLVIDGAALAKSRNKPPADSVYQCPTIDLGAFVESLRANCTALTTRLQQTLTSAQRNETAVTLLFDHSGSLRHNKSYLAVAEVAEALADALTDASITTEILGFTTVRWKGGEAREKWITDGRPGLPGRLTDLLHVIHVDGSSGPRVGPHRFAIMRDELLLKENIDGEALEWAQARLLENPRRQKILIVVSDGAPVDDATLAYNWASILHDHVREVANRITASAEIVLGGIGIEHNVESYYPNHVTAKPLERLADVAAEFVGKMIALAHQTAPHSSK